MTRAEPLTDALAALVDYPDGEFLARLAECRAVARAALPDAAALLDAFAVAVAPLPLTRVQEMYIDAFDLDPACALDLGWHLHGERRERGELLLALRQQLADAGIVETTQLPDHLTHVLRLLARQPADAREALASACADSLDRIRAALRERQSPFALLIDAVRTVVSNGAAVTKG